MPPSDPRWQQLDKKLPPDDHARIVRRQLKQLDRSIVDQAYLGVGKKAYDPMHLLAMVLYQYLKGRFSPATWEEEARLNEAMQWLGYGYTPARRTWYDFRDRVGGIVELLHEQVVQRSIAREHLDPSTAVLDGTSIAACASRHRMVNRETLAKRQQLLNELIEDSSERAAELPKWVPPTISGRRELALRMQQAAEVLAKRISENAGKPSGKRKDPEKIQVSLTDPIAPLGRDKRKTFRPLYTVQRMVAPVSLLTISYCCEASANDNGTLAPMIDKSQRIVGGRLKRVLADGGYCSILDLADAKDRRVELFSPPSASGSSRKCKSRSGELQIPREEFRFDAKSNSYCCPQGNRLAHRSREKKSRIGGRILYQSSYQGKPAECGSCPLAERCLSGKGPRMIKRTEGEELMVYQREKMLTEHAKDTYRVRGQTVELVFADAKGNRHVDRFHGRGLQRARGETGLLVLAQNLLRLDKLQRDALNSMNHAA